MRVLVIADASALWTALFVKNVLGGPNHDVVISSSSPAGDRYRELYGQLGVTVAVQPGRARWVSMIPGVRGIVARWRIAASLRSLEPFDATHILALIEFRMKLARCLGNHAGRLVVSCLGSDVLKSSSRQLKKLASLLAPVDVVTATSQTVAGRLVELSDPSVRDRVRVIPFGVNALDEIEKVFMDNPDPLTWAKSRLGIRPNAATIVVGYNGRRMQQHIQVLHAIGSMDSQILNNAQVILPMTYGADPGYVTQVGDLLATLPVQGVILEDFMSEATWAQLCVASDVFINAQTTDSFSASLQEFVFAGGAVLNGAWLEYSELDRFEDSQMSTFKTFDGLGVCIADAIARRGGERRRDTPLIDSIRDRTWDRLTPVFQNLYKADQMNESKQ